MSKLKMDIAPPARSGWCLIENDGAIFRGPNRGNPLEVLVKDGWKRYKSSRTPDVAWGTIVDAEEAAKFFGAPIPD